MSDIKKNVSISVHNPKAFRYSEEIHTTTLIDAKIDRGISDVVAFCVSMGSGRIY